MSLLLRSAPEVRRDHDAAPSPHRPLPLPIHRRLIPVSAVLVDVLAIAAASGVAVWARGTFDFLHAAPGMHPLHWVAPGIGLVWLLTVAIADGYQREVFGAGTDEYRRVVHASFVCASLIGVVAYLVQYELSRSYFALVFIFGVALLALGRFLLRRVLHRLRQWGHLRERVVIAGTGRHIDELAGVLARQPWLGYDVVGALTPPTQFEETTAGGIRVWGNSDDVKWAVETLEAGTVFVCAGAFRSAAQLRQAIWDLEHTDNLQVLVAPDVTDVSRDRIRIRPIGGLPVLHVDPPRHMHATQSAKRAFDVVGASCLLVIFAPLLALAAWRIRRHDGGPVLFRQTRIGRRGEEFACLKFRTMVPDAEGLLMELQRQSGFSGGLFKLKTDPRVTTPGRWLRRFSVDELPQLVNVLRGDMSLVGPRPPLLTEFTTYDDATRRRLHVRPGMTGLWQVSGRSDLSYAEAIRLDLYYVDNWSMIQDLTILLRTFQAVFASKGAY